MEMNLKYLATAMRKSDKYTLFLLDASECPEMLDTCFGAAIAEKEIYG